MHGSKVNPQMCWKWPFFFFLREAGTLPEGMPLVLGSVRFTVTHGRCCFMGLSTGQEAILWGNSFLERAQNHFLPGGNHSVCRLYMKLSGPCLSTIWPLTVIWKKSECSDPTLRLRALCVLFCFFSDVLVSEYCWVSCGCKCNGSLLGRAAVKRDLLVFVHLKVRNKKVVSAAEKGRKR